MIQQSETPIILIVDDIPANLVALRRILRDLNIKIIEAASGNEALALMLEHDFSLALLDVQMPEMSGFEVAEIMQTNESTSHIPIIFVTAHDTSEANVLKGYATGAVDYIVKPINKTILRSKIQVITELSRHKKKNSSQNELCNEIIPNLMISTNKPFENINNALSELQNLCSKQPQIDQLHIINHQQLNIQNILRCVSDISSFSRDSKKLPKQEVDIVKMLEDAVKKVQPQAITLQKTFTFSTQFEEPINLLGNVTNIKQILYYLSLCFINSSNGDDIFLACNIIDDSSQHMLIKLEFSDHSASTPDTLYNYFVHSAQQLEPSDEKNIMLSLTSDLLETVGGVIGRSIDDRNDPHLWITIPFLKSANITIDSIQLT